MMKAQEQRVFNENKPVSRKSALTLRWSEHFCLPSHRIAVVTLMLRNTEEVRRPSPGSWHGGGNNAVRERAQNKRETDEAGLEQQVQGHHTLRPFIGSANARRERRPTGRKGRLTLWFGPAAEAL